MKGIILAIALILSAVSPANSQVVYCAFEVTIKNPTGHPVAKIPVALVGQAKTTFSQAISDVNGVARLCDAPMEPVDIVVGLDICGSVMIRSLKPTWPSTQHLSATYSPRTCEFVSFREDCLVLLRIVDEEGRSVPGAEFATAPAATSGGKGSDAYGRLFRIVKKGQTLKGFVFKEGFASATVEKRCQDDLESKVVLHEKASGQ
jgi:hypothetical protein